MTLSTGSVAKFDEEDLDIVTRNGWAEHGRYVCGQWEHGRNVYLHRVIAEKALGPIPTGLQVDHINGDSADNSRENLRYVTPRQNVLNRKVQSNSPSGFTGIRVWPAGTRKQTRYEVKMYRDRKQIWHTWHYDLESAKKSREKAEKLYFGEFARKRRIKPND